VYVEVVRDNSVVGPNNLKAGRVDIPAKRSLLITALGKYQSRSFIRMAEERKGDSAIIQTDIGPSSCIHIPSYYA